MYVKKLLMKHTLQQVLNRLKLSRNKSMKTFDKK